MGTHESYMKWLRASDTRVPKIGTWLPSDQENPPISLFDGDQVLVAVPVMWKSGARQHASHDKNAKWFYEYSVVTFRCDEDYCRLECNGDAWGWEWSDVEWWMKLSEAAKRDPIPTQASPQESRPDAETTGKGTQSQH